MNKSFFIEVLKMFFCFFNTQKSKTSESFRPSFPFIKTNSKGKTIICLSLIHHSSCLPTADALHKTYRVCKIHHIKGFFKGNNLAKMVFPYKACYFPLHLRKTFNINS